MKIHQHLAFLSLALLTLSLSACPAPPERCQGCLQALADAGPVGQSDAVVEAGNGGGGPGSGGAPGTGGILGTGGTATGGAGTGGAATGGAGTGGMVGTGGAGTGGAATGGQGSGGRGTGGAATGGAASGGRGGTGGAASGTGGSGPDADLVLWYKFDEAAGTTSAVDSAMAGGTARNASLMTIGTGATAAFVTNRQVGSHAVSLVPSTNLPNANGAFVNIPTTLQTLAPAAITLAVWVNLPVNSATQDWERIFDFGSGTPADLNMYLTARAKDATNTPVRFAITKTGHAGTAEQRLDGTTALSVNAWHHIVVVLPAGTTYTGTLYVDGVAVGTNPAMTLHTSDLGATTQNWLGRSQFSDAAGSNPCFNGLLDDFRVYKRALTAAEITALYAVR